VRHGPHAPVVEKGLAAPGLLAHVVVSKYADHLPLHRMEERFAREGVHLPRSTLCDWVAQVANLLCPITDAMGKAMLGAHRIHTDDTGIPVQAQGRTQKGHVWMPRTRGHRIPMRRPPIASSPSLCPARDARRSPSCA
jgi:transposase